MIIFWSDLPTWNIRSGRIPNNSQILKYLHCSSKGLRIHIRYSGFTTSTVPICSPSKIHNNVIHWDDMIHLNPRVSVAVNHPPSNWCIGSSCSRNKATCHSPLQALMAEPSAQMLSWKGFIKRPTGKPKIWKLKCVCCFYKKMCKNHTEYPKKL